jgi:hypothetical protein
MWVILDGLAMEDVGIFCGHLVNFTGIWHTLWTFGIFCGNLVYFPPVLVCCTYQEKSGNPGTNHIRRSIWDDDFLNRHPIHIPAGLGLGQVKLGEVRLG